MNERSLAFTVWAALVPPGRKAQLNNMMVTVLEGDNCRSNLEAGQPETNHICQSPSTDPFIHSTIHPPTHLLNPPRTHPSTPLLIHPSVHPPSSHEVLPCNLQTLARNLI